MSDVMWLQEEPRPDPAVEAIRRHVAVLRQQVAKWEPRPMPRGWHNGYRQ